MSVPVKRCRWWRHKWVKKGYIVRMCNNTIFCYIDYKQCTKCGKCK